MKILSRKSLVGAFALAASLSAPLAFAQSAEASAQAIPPAEATVQAGTTMQAAKSEQGSTVATESRTASANTGSPVKKSWSDVDADKDGKLTKAEAGIVPALGQVFDQADGNADGTLTTEEYKSYVARMQGGAKADTGG